jgi:hypothetical protein
MKALRNALLTGILLAAGISSFAEVDVRVYVPIAPPVAVREVRPVTPGVGYVWIPGYHRWDGHVYGWVDGRWERPPRPHAVWVAGRWHRNSHGHYWIEGYWR